MWPLHPPCRIGSSLLTRLRRRKGRRSVTEVAKKFRKDVQGAFMRMNPIARSLIAAITFAAGAASAQEKVIYNFLNPDDASTPKGSLIFDASGNLYGTSYYGYYGDIDDATSGTVFELSPPSVPGGKWTEQVLWSAASNQLRNPLGNLIFDANGNLYGSATGVFELSPPSAAGGTWTETTLTSNEDSLGGLVFDSQGNLYGTSEYFFELSPPLSAGGNWTDQDLFTFDSESTGMAPVGDLIFDSKGNLYGVASQGGAYDEGMVFELSPASGGTWTENVIWSFGGQGDGVTPLAGLIFDSKGNL